MQIGPERQARLLVERSVMGDAPGKKEQHPARSITMNLAESPLGWLFVRGQVSQRQFDAGERLRADWERAQLGQRVTMSWDAAPVARTRGGAGEYLDLSGSQLDAKKRFETAVAEAGPGLSDNIMAGGLRWRRNAGSGKRTRLAGTGGKARASLCPRSGRGLLPDPLVAACNANQAGVAQ